MGRNHDMSDFFFNTWAPLLAIVSIAAASSSAHAADFKVEAQATTGGTPGFSIVTVGPLDGELEAAAESDPPATEWTYNLVNHLLSDAGAHTYSEIGSLSSHLTALAHRVAAKAFPAGPTGATIGRFADRLTVVSDTLPVGTPVTLTFQNAVSVDWEASGPYSGRVVCSAQIGVVWSSVQWSIWYTEPVPEVESPLIVVETKVGAKLGITGKLSANVSASYLGNGLYDGDIDLDASCKTPLLDATAGVQVIADSGVDYTAL